MGPSSMHTHYLGEFHSLLMFRQFFADEARVLFPSCGDERWG